MTRALPALLLAGCLQGGMLELDGTWVATVERGCTQSLTFGPGDAFASTLACPSGDTDEWRGVYTVDGDVLRIVDAAGETDLRWGWTGRDLLWVEQGGRGLRLRRAR